MNLDRELFGKPEPLFAGSPRFVRLKTALALIGVSRSTLYKMIGTGDIRAIRVGGSTMVDLSSVAALYARCPEITPRKHQRVVSGAAMGFEPEPALYLADADLDALGLDGFGGPTGESTALPGHPMPEAAANAPRAAAGAANAD